MNFLPFVLVLITIFAGLNTLLMQQQKTVLIEEKAYSGYMNAQRQVAHQATKKHYEKIKPKAKPKNNNENDKKPPKPKKSPREQGSYRLSSRLSIHAILFNETPNEQHLICFKNLLRELYGHLPGFTDLDLDSFIQHWKAYVEDDSFELAQITYADELEQSIFYKMLKGCAVYDTENLVGYPPLMDFISFDKTQTPIALRSARPPLLRAAFGDVAKVILAKEAEGNEHKPLSWSEVEQLLNDQHFDASVIAPLIRDSAGRQHAETVATDSNHWTRVRH